MRRSLLALSALVCLLATPSIASAYTATLSAPTTVDGQAHTFTFNNLPAGSGNVTLTVGLQGDFSWGNQPNPEGSVNYADGVNLGTFIPANEGGGADCSGAIYTKNFTFSTSYVNDNNQVVILIDLYPEVGTFCTGQQTISATISYTSNTAPVLSSIANQTTPEDTADSVGFAVSDAEDSNGAVGVSVTSSNTAVISNVSASNSSGAGTVSWTPVGNASGTTTLTLTATDSGGATAVRTFTVTVTPVNDPPVASGGGPYAGAEGSAIALNGSASSDIDDGIAFYRWDCENDGTVDVIVASATGGACTYDNNGAFTASLVVEDVAGAHSAPNLVTVVVSNVAPSGALAGPSTGNEGQVLTWTASATDPSSVDAAALSYAWTVTDAAGTSVASGTGPAPTFTPSDNGTFTVTSVVSDPEGASDTDSITVTVSNVAPTVAITGPSSGSEGSALAWTLVGTDPSSVDAAALTYGWTITDAAGTSVANGTGPSPSWTPANNGSYTLTGSTTDPQGAIDLDTLSLSIANVAPVVLSVTGPGSGAEGQSLSFTSSVTDAGSADVSGLVSTWAWGDATATTTGTTASHTYADDGTYTVTLTVVDPDGASDSDAISVTVSNVAPTLLITGAATGAEGSPGSWTLVGADVGTVDAGALTYAWSITDAAGAAVGNGTGSAPSWTPADDGAYTLSATVSDPQGATDTQTLSLSISNVAPTVLSVTGPSTGDEGQSLAFSATVSDVGSTDNGALVTTWSWGDATAIDTGLAVPHTFADDGTYTVTVTVTDPNGDTGTDSLTVVVANLPPVIDSSPPTAAYENVLYTYLPTVTDPGDEVFAWTLSASAPAAMTIDGATGLLSWTPTYADALAGSVSLVLTVDDGDGATDAQSWTVTVAVADDDADGMADSWELANGLDPTDPSDAAGDPDADGMSNLDEFGNGTDPAVYDGPSAPTLVDPIGGIEVADVSPDLTFDNATDPNGDVLTYEVQLFTDSTMATLVASAAGVAEDASGQTSWKVDVALTENAEYWWRARASDPWVAGPWAPGESFVINAANQAPDVPVLTFPIAGETAASATPILVWSEAEDIDGDEATYDVEVFDTAGTLITSATGVVGDGVSANWEVGVALDEDTWYAWTARAVDEHGLAGDFAADEVFFVSTSNAAPSDTVFIGIDDGSSIVTLSPTLGSTVSTDPEGGPVQYWYEVDTVVGFNGADYATATVSDPLWSLSDDGIALPEDTWIYARVRALDEGGVSSVPDTITFFVRGDNDAPEVPVLSAPADGSEGGATPTLEVLDPVDPEGDAVLLDFLVARDAEMTEILAEVTGKLVTGTGTTTWLVDANLQGTVYWTARAVDLDGAASDWATPWSYVAPTEAVPPAGDDDDDDDGTGCDCQTSVAGGARTGLLALALLLPLGMLRRRRS